jgi:16S rRNA (guanine966-N2)-methyltransferase
MTSRTSNQTLRIIGGNYRGRKITFPDVPDIRPTPNRIRETLFNWLTPHLAGARCLEPFAGSGILSIEALSRGARTATIIDKSSRIIQHIEQQLISLGMDPTRISLHQDDAINWLKQQSGLTTRSFDVVFLDPPFATKLLDKTCDLLAQSDLLSIPAWVYLESDVALSPASLPPGWLLYRQKKAGSVHYGLCKTA